uniref:Uncharacterized protein n=1 Tax=Arundo donax TaxID=35708 RepID=A0A0A8ZY68_ARUDO
MNKWSHKSHLIVVFFSTDERVVPFFWVN